MSLELVHPLWGPIQKKNSTEINRITKFLQALWKRLYEGYSGGGGLLAPSVAVRVIQVIKKSSKTIKISPPKPKTFPTKEGEIRKALPSVMRVLDRGPRGTHLLNPPGGGPTLKISLITSIDRDWRPAINNWYILWYSSSSEGNEARLNWKNFCESQGKHETCSVKTSDRHYAP